MGCERGSGVLVRLVDIFHGDDRQVAVIAEVAEGDAGAVFYVEVADGVGGDVEADGHAEEVAVGQSAIFHDAFGR